MDQIKNIVYLMLENRSLDNVLGWLYKDAKPLNVIPKNSSPVFNGLYTGKYYNPDQNGVQHPVTTAQSLQVPSVDPNEVYYQVNAQLYGSQDNPPLNKEATMLGFLNDFNDNLEILQCYDPPVLYVLNTLAQFYAVSDAYFSSIPSQTNCNRAFAGSGNSIGTLWFESTSMVDNHWDDDVVNPWNRQLLCTGSGGHVAYIHLPGACLV